MGRSTVHYADNTTNNTLKKLHNKLRPAGTPVQRVEYIIELLLLRIFEAKLKHDQEFQQLRPLFRGENENLLFSSLFAVPNEKILPTLNNNIFPFYSRILSEARKVLKGNPSIKVQDQLVLIEEVFGNSNFTNNVTSGNLQEVISLVGELDEERLLKTDLLGDAIESSLSETGGTKDIGLYRTPDHIRHFMVGIVEPDFSDLVLDPACGTGGFLFDGFEYVMESVSKEGKWPGPKAHPEMAAWFKEHFAKKKTPMPSIEATTDFYRNGVMGIEYLGMIRKMASINFYIRGLNPANIIQGDSLARFKKDFFPESKTAVLANPPFGAERDQEAYPDVWSEYPKESETTILFVKLMLECLKKGGRCAVIVSEGFMTWDQNSARALRKSLLEDANLRAVISLPQGVFVSKGGQGPKTSILYFEKGAPTRHVWFYKVAKDGYTSGTNRKQIAGCQFTEALDLFHRYVQKGEIPPDTRHSFTIPVDWIKALDPRVKERIRTETTEEMTAKAAEERAKLADTLNTRLEGGKISQEEFNDRLKQHDLLWKGKISNEIARRIERAHLYSFNLPNYRSNLSQPQIDAWTAFAAERETVTDETLDRQYARLKSANTEELDRLLSAFDPRNALELDIARQFLIGLAPQVVENNPHLTTLTEIITTASKYPRVKMKELLTLNNDKISPSDCPETIFRVLGVSNESGIFMNEKLPGATIKQSYFRVKPNEFCYNPYRINVGSIGLNEFDFDNQIISGAYVVFGTNESELNPKFLLAFIKTPYFLKYVNERAHGGVRMNFKFEYFEDWEIPLPPIEAQGAIAAELERQRAIVAGADMIQSNHTIDAGIFDEFDMCRFEEVVADIQNGLYKNAEHYGAGTPIVRIGDYKNGQIIESCAQLNKLSLSITEQAKYLLAKDDILLNRVNSLEHVGKAAIIGNFCEPVVYESNMMRIKVNGDIALPKYIFYVLSLPIVSDQLKRKSKRAINQVSVNQQDVHDLIIPLPSKEIQKGIVGKLEQEFKLLDDIELLRMKADQNVNTLLSMIWEN